MSDVNSINLNLFRFFLVSAESNSLAEAGEKLGYTASNISANIAILENQLGTQLFTRKPLKLTETGQAIYETVKRGFGDIDFALVIAQCKNNLKYGKINIGCPSHITEFFLMERIANAIEDYPNLQISLNTESSSYELIENLKNNKIDFAILDLVPRQYEKDIEIEEMKHMDNIFVANKKIEIKNIEELNNYKYILSYDDRASTIKLMETLKEYNVNLNAVLRCPTTEQRINGARYGIGLAYVIKESAKRDIEAGKLFEVKLPIKLPTSTMKIVYLKHHLTKVDKEFINNYLK